MRVIFAVLLIALVNQIEVKGDERPTEEINVKIISDAKIKSFEIKGGVDDTIVTTAPPIDAPSIPGIPSSLSLIPAASSLPPPTTPAPAKKEEKKEQEQDDEEEEEK